MTFIRDFCGSIVSIVAALAAVAVTADGGRNLPGLVTRPCAPRGAPSDTSKLSRSGTLGSLVSDGQLQ
jgi:hypothetical protein